MSEFIIKLAGALPKAEAQTNGWDDSLLAQELWETKIEGRHVQPRVAIVIYGVQEAKVDKKGDQVVTVDVRRVQPVATVDSRRALEGILTVEYRAQSGAHILPYEVEQITKAAFIDLPRTTEEIDAREAEELDHMSPTDELRRHLERLHGHEGAHLYTAEEADAKHRADHDGNLAEGLEHNIDWIGWTRADIELAAGDGEDDSIQTAGHVFQANADADDARGIDPAADWSNTDKTDPDEGRDIDHENSQPVG